MANSYKGKIEYIEPTQSIQRQGKEPWLKRRVMLDVTRYDGLTGERGYEKHIIFEFSGKHVSIPDQYKAGDVVEILFDVDSYKGTKKDGTQDWFTSVRGYDIKRIVTQPAAPQGGMPQGAAQQNPFPPQQPAQGAPANNPMGGMNNQFQPSGGGQDPNVPF